MRRHPAGDAHADRCDLPRPLPTCRRHPDTRQALDRGGGKIERGERLQDRHLQVANVLSHVLAVAVEIEDRVTDELPRCVIGRLAAAIGLDEVYGGALRDVKLGSLVGPSSGRDHRRMMEYSHTHGILHRDIKPANLLIDDEDKLWVTDFGLARAKDNCNLTRSGELLGTLRYMSPEQVSGRQSGIDERTDVYSLGVTLYELLSLTPAYGGDNEPELLRRIAFEEPQRLRQINRRIPIDLETIVAKAMEKCAADRYSSALEFANDLRRYLAAEPIKAKRASPAERMVKWSRRHHDAGDQLRARLCAA